jgi:hypothetical protein
VFTQTLVEFLFRLTFGVAAAMAVTPSRLVTSGFFRVHLWVLLGVQTLAALAIYSAASAAQQAGGGGKAQLAAALAAAIVSYIGSVIWMYERRLAGKIAILVVACCSLIGCWLPILAQRDKAASVALELADRFTGGMLLGAVVTAMLLGHWYLNTPTMKLDPLKRLILLLAVAVGLRMAVCLPGAWLLAAGQLSTYDPRPQAWIIFLALRWLSGLIGVLGLAWLTWQTLKIPNTQSATGILYAGVVLVFIGELTSQLLSAQTRYPV